MKLMEEFDEPDKLRIRVMKSNGGFSEKESIRAS